MGMSDHLRIATCKKVVSDCLSNMQTRDNRHLLSLTMNGKKKKKGKRYVMQRWLQVGADSSKEIFRQIENSRGSLSSNA